MNASDILRAMLANVIRIDNWSDAYLVWLGRSRRAAGCSATIDGHYHVPDRARTLAQIGDFKIAVWGKAPSPAKDDKDDDIPF